PPTVAFIADKTSSRDIYDFLYHATSHFVHFRVHELLRRAWGQAGCVSIRSVHFGNYWSAFCLYWGLRLYLDTLIALESIVSQVEVSLGDSLLVVAQRIADFGQVPLITPEELAWRC